MKRRESSFGSFGNLRGNIFLFEDTEYNDEWGSIEEHVRQMERVRKDYRDLAQDMTRKEQDMATEIKNTGKTLTDLEKRVLKDENVSGDPSRKSEISSALKEKKRLLETMSKVLPQKSSLILRLSLGDINVTLPRLADRLKYKESYELFKLRMTFVAFVFTFGRMILVDFLGKEFRILDVLFQCFLAWYYSTITLREHVLIANGSHIRQWWLWHHYLSLVILAVVLVWPDGTTYRLFYPHFNVFACFLGFVQLLEFQYQRKRLYTLRALGKTDAMDVPAEGVQVQWSCGLPLLFPFLLLCQVWILYVGYFLTTLAGLAECTEWQVPTLAALFLVVGVGNLYTNMITGRKVIRYLIVGGTAPPPSGEATS
eukprot:comp19077_c0_seq1/m.21560 comp19077_c0_seq1/g.21560  ORF comp19077_c0_seq1/g.21560 comp19077_c0_seq1/m.21560 type:complete len:369 (-) comp19077_c0_seq1:377-1483(-)